jgi:hypothetical protein
MLEKLNQINRIIQETLKLTFINLLIAFTKTSFNFALLSFIKVKIEYLKTAVSDVSVFDQNYHQIGQKGRTVRDVGQLGKDRIN